ncbi:hypothetical protein CEE44_04225 [Candidatus Woesearchaeota archaeon B3_Woes]|nr:MAG: hypothetical protein CEE44_04225 [Candidatus Woesearchaeota archaeon B3_Woes]
MEAEDYFKGTKVYVWRKDFAIIKSNKTNPNAFANIVDKKETTVIIEEGKYNNEDIIEIEKGWKILTFDIELPFSLTDFLAKISNTLAQEKISIFVVSTYSTDHILIKKQDLQKAEEKLKNLGFIIEEK